MIQQLDFFEDNGKELKPIDYSSPIGMYKELKDVQGADQLTDKALELLHYLYINHARPEDGFIHAKELAGLLGYWDTRELRKLCAEIDLKTEMVIYASQRGYKLASTPEELREAVKFSLAPAMTAIRRVFAKSKEETLHWMHGFIGNLEKEFGGHAQGQQQFTEEGFREVNHYPDQPFVDYMPPIDERVKNHKKREWGVNDET